MNSSFLNAGVPDGNPKRLLPFIAGLFIAALLISVTIAGKLFQVGPFILSASVLLFPLVFLLNDVLTEVYGYSATRQVLWCGFLAEILLAAIYSITISLPSPAFFQNQSAFSIVLGMAPRIVIASISAFLVGGFCNSLTLAKMKIFSKGRNMQARFVLSTAVGEAVDSLVFYPIAFLGLIPPTQFPSLIASTWFVKVMWEVVALPASVPLTRILKRYVNVDFFDDKTDFNPFLLSDN